MPMNYYVKRKFSIETATGEGAKIFGALAKGSPGPRPTVEIDIDATDGKVKFTVMGAPTDATIDLAKDAHAFYRDGYFIAMENWPDQMQDIIIGYINYGKKDDQQLFLMWIRMDSPIIDLDNELKLGFYIFPAASPFSSGTGDIENGSLGEESGGGSGNGPR